VPERNPGKKKFLQRREYGPSYFVQRKSGLADAARKCAEEEQLMKAPILEGQWVN